MPSKYIKEKKENPFYGKMKVKNVSSSGRSLGQVENAITTEESESPQQSIIDKIAKLYPDIIKGSSSAMDTTDSINLGSLAFEEYNEIISNHILLKAASAFNWDLPKLRVPSEVPKADQERLNHLVDEYNNNKSSGTLENLLATAGYRGPWPYNRDISHIIYKNNKLELIYYSDNNESDEGEFENNSRYVPRHRVQLAKSEAGESANSRTEESGESSISNNKSSQNRRGYRVGRGKS